MKRIRSGTNFAAVIATNGNGSGASVRREREGKPSQPSCHRRSSTTVDGVTPAAGSASQGEAIAFAVDPHRLDVYAVALDFHRQASALAHARGLAPLRDQLGRASLSVVLNIAEGSGRFSPADKARFYGMARGSACECAAILDVLDATGNSLSGERDLLARIVRMLTRLIAAMKARR